jgi:hypothetical protein
VKRALLLSFLVGCAAARPSTVSDEDRVRVVELERALATGEHQLDAARAESTPDCTTLCRLAGNVCELAEKVCAIATRYPPDDPVAAACRDDRARCRRATDAVAARCACPK